MSKYATNSNYFEVINTEKKAYFLGLFAADGCNYRKKDSTRCFISLQEQDKEVLEILNNEVFPLGDRKLLYNNSRKPSRPQWKFEAFDTKMSDDLQKHGVTKNKSLTLEFPTTVPKKYIHHFIRGYFDGDGCIGGYISKHRKTPKYRISILSTKKFLESLVRYIPTSINSTIRIRGKIHELCISGNNQVKEFGKFIYNNAHIFLTRKYTRYLQLKKDLKSLAKRMSSKYKGVSYSKNMKKWLAYFSKRGKPQLKVGWFNTEDEAFDARNRFTLPTDYKDLENTKGQFGYGH